MGSCFRICSGGSYVGDTSEPIKPYEPKPDVFKVQGLAQGEKYLVVEVTYPNCINFEGRKILVMKNTTMIDILHAKELDPHFYEDNNIIARFRPDKEGRRLAFQMSGIKE